MEKPQVKVINDYDGEWAQMWVNGELYREGHSDYSDWYVDFIQEYLGIEIDSEEKCLDDCHTYCSCSEEVKKAALADLGLEDNEDD